MSLHQFFFSNITMMIAMLKLMANTPIYNCIGTVKKNVLVIDPTVEVFHHKHIVCLLIAIIPFLLVSQFPSLLLLIYPTRLYQYLSRFLSARKRLAITAFAEAIHSCFKDGLNGTTDYRALAAMNFFSVIPYDIINGHLSTILGYPEYVIDVSLWVLCLCVMTYLKPCKEKIANISVIYHLFLCAILVAVPYLWWNDSSVQAHTLEVTFIATGLASHLLVVLWASYILTRLAVRKYCTPMPLRAVAERVRLCFSSGHGYYRELLEKASIE